MPKKKSLPTPVSLSDLRSLAEKRYQVLPLKRPDYSTSPEDILRIIHELEVHQIELELQQDELIQSRDEQAQLKTELERSLKRFTELYDFAPLGYVTLSRGSQIVEANLTAAKILGVNRSALVGNLLTNLFIQEDRHVIYGLLEKVFTWQQHGYCEVTLLPDKKLFPKAEQSFVGHIFRIDALISDSAYDCRAILTDVTDQKISENALKQSQYKFRMLFEGHSSIMLVIDETGSIIDANPSAAAFYGLPIEKLCTMHLDKITTRSHDAVMSDLVNFRATKQNRFTALHRLADGSLRDVEVVKNTIAIGSTIVFYCIINDITERKQAEKLLLDSNERYSSLFKNMLNGIAYCRMIVENGSPVDYIYEQVNARFELMTGLTNVEGKRVSEVIPGIHQISPELLEIYGQVVTTGIPERFEFYLEPLKIWLEISAYSLQKDNFVAVFDNITQRKQADAEIKKLSTALQQSPTVVVITDPLGNIEYVNPAFTAHTGYSAEEVKGENPRILKSGLMHDSFYEDLWQTILSGRIWRGEMQNKKKNGELFWERAVISALLNSDGVATNFVAVKEDITAEKQLWDELTAAKVHAEESDRLKSAFLANISHEIRTPMNGILGFSELLKEPHISGEEQAEFIGLIQQSGNRMLNLINELIDISRYDAGETTLQISKTPVNALLHDLFAFFKPEIEEKGLCLNCTCELSDAESIIETDSGKLTQILTNLIQNALKFTNSGTIDFGYTKSGSKLEFYVLDTGIGVPAEMQQKIFERFWQADNTLTRNHQGSGLGLSISKAYVEMLGGTIQVESREGQGSRFSFTLPDILSRSTQMPPSSSVIQESAKTAPGITILIAEDDEMCRLLLQKSLTCENITILYAVNGKEAVELVKCHQEITLVLMDIKMPVMNGYEATRLIKQLRPDLPVIAQSAFTSKKDREKAIEAGCDSFITKPIYKSELLEVIQLETAMQSTLQAVANVVEAHDPYTAGHERRVGIISADIAREMGWSEEKCHTLQFIGLVHDIGKMSIPAEILSKPGRLSAIEFELVKNHAEQGYQILKDVEFSLPIAEIIREHHERMDGSGYPQGLKGEETLLEARILAVADVLEAMASHRPYRAAFGLEVALHEIESHRGEHFDPDVVDAMLRLFREKGYQLPV